MGGRGRCHAGLFQKDSYVRLGVGRGCLSDRCAWSAQARAWTTGVPSEAAPGWMMAHGDGGYLPPSSPKPAALSTLEQAVQGPLRGRGAGQEGTGPPRAYSRGGQGSQDRRDVVTAVSVPFQKSRASAKSGSGEAQRILPTAASWRPR